MTFCCINPCLIIFQSRIIVSGKVNYSSNISFKALVSSFAPTPHYANVLFFHIKEQSHERTLPQVNKNSVNHNALDLKHHFCPSTSLHLKIVYIVKVDQVYLPTYPVSTQDYGFGPTAFCVWQKCNGASTEHCVKTQCIYVLSH